VTKTYTVTARVWLYPGDAPWHFVSIPPDISEDIDFYFAHVKRGFGSLRVNVTIGATTWQTSIFPDKSQGTYMLPLKAKARKLESIHEGNTITLTVEVLE